MIYASAIYEIFLRLLMFENNISPFALCIQGIISAERKLDSIKQISNTQDTRLLQRRIQQQKNVAFTLEMSQNKIELTRIRLSFGCQNMLVT